MPGFKKTGDNMRIVEYIKSDFVWLMLPVLMGSVLLNVRLFLRCRKLEDEKRTLEYELAGTYVDDIIGLDD